MAASSDSCSSFSCPPFCSTSSKNPPFPTLSLLSLLLSFFLLSITLFLLSILKRLNKRVEVEQHDPQSQTSISSLKQSLSSISNKTQNSNQLNSTQVSQSLLLEVSPSISNEWDTLFSPVDTGPHSGCSDGEGEIREGKKKKKSRRKGKKNLVNVEENRETNEELVCLYPFTSSSSATQRKIKQQYDQLVKSHESKGLTLAQVGEFVNCLVEAKNGLQQKSECIKRKFTITKALLLKADRSSFDRYRQQIGKLELEQKRLEEDAFVYNWLQHQLKLSPAYKKMVELGACMELKAKAGEFMENPDNEQNYISFEDFLAQEKKDTFWKKYSKLKSC
ncbi:unnamed protein product [Amaranthus hypochondriacus]